MIAPGAEEPSGAERSSRARVGVLDLLFRWSEEDPGRLAITWYGDDGRPACGWSYRELAAAALAVSARLRLHLGADQAAILRTPNSLEVAAWILGGLHAGVRLCLLNAAATDRELLSVATSIRGTLVAGPRPAPGLTHLRPELARPETAGISAGDRRGPGSVILQSSGSTGCVRHPRRTESSLDADAHGLRRAAGLQGGDRVLIAVPLTHSYGVDLLVSAVAAGSSLHVCDGFDIARIERIRREQGITVLPGVPFMFEAMARACERGGRAEVRLAFSAGSPLPPGVQDRLQSAWSLPIVQLYGASELGTVTFGPTGDASPEPGCIGSPVSGVSVRVLSPDGGPDILPEGAEGELAFRAPSMLCEYVDAELTLADGYFRTGDLGRLDGRGRVHLTGRLKHLIDIGGLKVNPFEVERVFGEHPAIGECALVPLPMSETVVKLRLLYVPRNGARPGVDELRAFGRERLAPYKLPRVFDPVQELPRSATGKLLRHRIGTP